MKTCLIVLIFSVLLIQPVRANRSTPGEDDIHPVYEAPESVVARVFYDELLARYRALQDASASSDASFRRQIASRDEKIADQQEQIASLMPYRASAMQQTDAAGLALTISRYEAKLTETLRDLSEAEAGLASVRSQRDQIQGALRDSEHWREVLPLAYPGCRFYQDVIGPTGSMRPTVYASDLEFNLIFEPSCGESAKTGDILTYATPDWDTCQFPDPRYASWFVMHRARQSFDGGFVMKGDHNASFDPCLVPRSAVLSKVVAVTAGMYPERNGDR